ncbi:MAG: hypothetical protein ACKVIR_04520 [Candidatus Poseidoniales archaeon]
MRATRLWSTKMEVNGGDKTVVAGTGTALPNPYGGGFVDADDPLEISRRMWSQAENQRIAMGNFASKSSILFLRRLTGGLMAITALAGVVVPSQKPAIAVAFFIPLLALSIVPALLAGERAISAMTLRSSLWKQGAFIKGLSRDMMAEPGMDRIKAGINDARRHNAVAAILAGASLLLLVSSAGLETDGLAYNLVLLVTMATSLGLAFHAIFTTDEIRRLGDRLPYLILHAPTHHPTQLDTILGDLVLTHLDPDLTQSWKIWEGELGEALLPGVDRRQARERLLYLLHLNNSGALGDEDTIGEMKEFIKPMKLSTILFDEDSEFNWRRLQRLIQHARSWRSEVFDLLDRLQNDLLSGSAAVTRDDWRMDLALGTVSNDGTGHLFIAINNQTNNNRHLRVEVVVPGGVPESQNHRFELSACPGPQDSLSLADPLLEDALDWMPRYLEKGVILWIALAWKNSSRKPRNVQVILRDDDGVVLDSRIITSEGVSTESQLENRRLKRMLAARITGESKLPKPILQTL